MKQQKIGQAAAVCLAVCIMMAAAAALHCREIIFPEIAAVAVGAMIAPKRAWQVSRPRMIFWIAVCAVLGVVIVRYVPLPAWMQMSLAFAICQIFLGISRTGFAPMISAAVLPVMLGTTTLIYPIAAVLLTTLAVVLTIGLEQLGWRETEPYCPQPYPDRQDRKDMLIRILSAALTIFAALQLNVRFAAAPPLLVAFTEFSKRSCPARKFPIKAVCVLAGAAALGAGCRGLFTEWLGLPSALSAVITIALVIALLHRMQIYLPPAGALSILAFLVPQQVLPLYPVEILVGAGWLMLLAKLLFRDKALASPSHRNT